MMKIFFSIIFILLVTTGFAQKITSNVIAVSDEKIEKYVDSTCWRLGRVSLADLDCDKFKTCERNTLELAFSNCSPEASQQEKLSTRVNIKSEVTHLIEMASCSETIGLILYLGEGIFIDDKDKMPFESKKYMKNASALNTSRFIDQFGALLSAAYPNQNIYIINWLW